MADQVELQATNEPATAPMQSRNAEPDVTRAERSNDIRVNAGERIELSPIDQLVPYSRNARTHSRKQVRQLAASMRRYGFTVPVLIDEDNQILAGHGRVEAAKLVGLAAVPTIRLSHLSPAERRCSGSGARNAVKPSPRIFPAISLSNLAA